MLHNPFSYCSWNINLNYSWSLVICGPGNKAIRIPAKKTSNHCFYAVSQLFTFTSTTHFDYFEIPPAVVPQRSTFWLEIYGVPRVCLDWLECSYVQLWQKNVGFVHENEKLRCRLNICFNSKQFNMRGQGQAWQGEISYRPLRAQIVTSSYNHQKSRFGLLYHLFFT